MPTKSTKMKLKIRWTLLSCPQFVLSIQRLFNTDWCLLIEWNSANKRHRRALRGIVGIHGCQLSKPHKIWLFALPPSHSLYLPTLSLAVSLSQPPACACFRFFFHTHHNNNNTSRLLPLRHFASFPFSCWFLVSVWLMLFPTLHTPHSLRLYVFSVCCRATLNSLQACTNMSAVPPFLFAIKKHVCLPPLWP